MSGSLPRRDNGLSASSYVRLDDVETHLVDELLDRLRDAGVAAYSAPTAGRRGPYGEMVPPLGPSDSVYVDAAHPGRARAVADLYLREIRDDIAWADIVAGYDAVSGDGVPRWPVSEDVDPDAGADDDGGDDPEYAPETPSPAIGFEELRAGRPAPLDVDDPDDHYQPPPPPPLPDIDRVARFAWAGTLGGPLVLVIAAVAGARLEDWVGFLAVAAFVAGFVTLIARMKDRPPADSGPDDGAVVYLFEPEGTPVPSETVEVRGHLIDSGILSRVLDDILEYTGDYRIDKFEVGKTPIDQSYAQLTVSSDNDDDLARLVMRLQTHGVNPTDPGEVTLREVEQDGVFPDDFYSTTNLETVVRLGGHWVPVENPEMDCGIVVVGDRARTIPVSDIKAGDRLVCGAGGIKVVPLPAIDRSAGGFEFMNSEVSSEKPQALLVRLIAQQMRDVKADGKKVLWVGGPAVVHTGAAPAMVALVEAGYVDVLFAGNALATHDIEASLFGTSLGVDLKQGRGVEHGHEHHIRAINQIRKAGSIAKAVESGVLTGGVMHSLVRHGKDFVLVGSVRDDGPLPDVYTDVIEGQRAMRAGLKDVGFAIMVATMLHSVATGNILPASIPLVCVDINPATVTKLADRGSAQARGIVTDIGLFLEQLALELAPSYRAGERPGDDA